MPPSRRKPSNTTNARAQQTLAFGPTPNKITKASLPTPTTGNSKKKPHPPTDTARLQKALSDKLPTAPSEEEEEANDDEPPPPPEEQEDAQSARTNLAIRPPAEAEAKADDVKKKKTTTTTRSETMEGKGSTVSEAQIRRYWQGKEEERIAPRVHQTGLSVEEKVLRHFDLSTQYGVRSFPSFFLFPFSVYVLYPYIPMSVSCLESQNC